MTIPNRLGALGALMWLGLASACAMPSPDPMAPGPTGPGPTGPDPTPSGPDDPMPVPSPRPACPDGAEATFATLVSEMRAALETNGVPGGAIAVVCGEQVAFVEAIGVRRRGGTDPVTRQTRFQWASSTKMLTAATAVALAEERIVELDAPLSTYLDVGFGDITLRQLLSHTAGFPTDFDTFDPDLATLIAANREMRMWAPPGAVWNYSNPGFSVAGRALEAASGRPFAELVSTRVLAPAGMQATLSTPTVMAGDFAYGHTTDPSYPAPIAPDGAYFHTTYYGPMGGVWGSIDDFARWLEVHVRDDGSVLSHDALTSMRTAHTRTTYPGTSYGYGMFVEASTPTLIHHGGSAPGFLAEWYAAPEAGFGIAILVNSDAWSPSAFADSAVSRFIDVRYDAIEVPEGDASWAHYVGAYDDPIHFGRVTVTSEGGHLYARFSARGDQRVELTPYWGDAYETQLAGDWLDVNFWRDGPSDDASYLVSLWGVARRVE
ncbi:MAG: serine hydrolase [Sandaracinaceae bacterium]